MYILILLEFHSLEEIPWQRNNHVFIGIFPFTNKIAYLQLQPALPYCHPAYLTYMQSTS